ncbi:uncharacterized protein LOC122182338 [Lagopus leucura]|uniref:uncharacterized protein LOC122182338 n=1 Tax=Lagopus leucura TaxID=30410 RepID=UPI001C677D68|nr:uncharacterized protein LOC122182338 [Lagopus leucura]
MWADKDRLGQAGWSDARSVLRSLVRDELVSLAAGCKPFSLCFPSTRLNYIKAVKEACVCCDISYELDHILSPPPMPFRKSSNPEVLSGPGKSFKYKRQLSEDGRQLRRGSLGGALTGKYLLPNANGHQLWQPAETTNLVRMRCQALGQSAPSLTVSSDYTDMYMAGLSTKLPEIMFQEQQISTYGYNYDSYLMLLLIISGSLEWM